MSVSLKKMKAYSPESRADRRSWLMVIVGGSVVFLTFAAMLSIAFLTDLRDRRAVLLSRDLPRLIETSAQRAASYFDRVSGGMALLASLEDWEERLAAAVAAPQALRMRTEFWSEVVGAIDISVVDIPRRLIYTFWSADPVRLDPTLPRDAWFFEKWAVDVPPESQMTFYYDPDFGGHAVFFDRLVRSSRGQPLAIVGAMLPLAPLAELLRTDLDEGEFVYCTDLDGAVVLEVTAAGFTQFAPVYDAEGVISPHSATEAAPQTAIPERYLRSLPQDGVSFTNDGRYAAGAAVLPFGGLTVQVYLDAERRVGAVRARVVRQLLLLLAMFAVLTGGYIILTALFTRRRAQQLALTQQSREQLDDLVSVLVHNLGNDLHLIRGELAANSPLQGMGALVTDMEQTLQNAVYAARIGSGTTEPVDRPLVPAQLCRRLVDAVQASAAVKGQRVVLLVPPEAAPAAVESDEDLLFHLLLNLLSNAIKYAPPSATAYVAFERDATGVSFFVADDGPGFTTEDRSRLFLRGVRLSARPTAGERSTGLGLYVSRRLSNLLGAELLLVPHLPGWAPTAARGAIWRVSVPKAAQRVVSA